MVFSMGFRYWLTVVAMRSLLLHCLLGDSEAEAGPKETVAFLGTSHWISLPNSRNTSLLMMPRKHLEHDLREANQNASDMTKHKMQTQSFPRNPKENYPATCQCGLKHFSPRTARIVMPMNFVLASRVPKAVVAKSNGSFEESAFRFFPGAQPSSRVLSLVYTTLKRRHYTTSNTLFGTSICPDEINSKPSKSLSADLQKSLSKQNGVFSLGGLGGLPFVGEAGMQAFLSHCPQQGKVFIFFGPHVGITNQGDVGKVERSGRSSPSAACGAVVAAYNEIRQGKKNKQKSKASMNYQEDYIVSKLSPVVKQIKSMEDSAVAALITSEMYRQIEIMLRNELEMCWQTNQEFWDNITEVTLLGGVLINRGQVSKSSVKCEDYFQPLLFETWTKPGVKITRPTREDLYQSTFGADPPSQVFASSR